MPPVRAAQAPVQCVSSDTEWFRTQEEVTAYSLDADNFLAHFRHGGVNNGTLIDESSALNAAPVKAPKSSSTPESSPLATASFLDLERVSRMGVHAVGLIVALGSRISAPTADVNRNSSALAVFNAACRPLREGNPRDVDSAANTSDVNPAGLDSTIDDSDTSAAPWVIVVKLLHILGAVIRLRADSFPLPDKPSDFAAALAMLLATANTLLAEDFDSSIAGWALGAAAAQVVEAMSLKQSSTPLVLSIPILQPPLSWGAAAMTAASLVPESQMQAESSTLNASEASGGTRNGAEKSFIAVIRSFIARSGHVHLVSTFQPTKSVAPESTVDAHTALVAEVSHGLLQTAAMAALAGLVELGDARVVEATVGDIKAVVAIACASPRAVASNSEDARITVPGHRERCVMHAMRLTNAWKLLALVVRPSLNASDHHTCREVVNVIASPSLPNVLVWLLAELQGSEYAAAAGIDKEDFDNNNDPHTSVLELAPNVMVPYALCPGAAIVSATLAASDLADSFRARVLNSLFASLGEIACIEQRFDLQATSSSRATGMASGGGNRSERSSESEASGWLGSFFSSSKTQPSPNTAAAHTSGFIDGRASGASSYGIYTSTAVEQRYGFLLPVLRCLVAAITAAGASDGPPTIQAAVLTCLETIVEKLPTASAIVGGVEIWPVLLGSRFLRGGRRALREWELVHNAAARDIVDGFPPRSNSSSSSSSRSSSGVPRRKESTGSMDSSGGGGTKASSASLQSSPGAAGGAEAWCFVQDRCLRVLHRIILEAPTSVRTRLLTEASHGLRQVDSGRLAALRMARWAMAITQQKQIDKEGEQYRKSPNGGKRVETLLPLPPLPQTWLGGEGTDAVVALARSCLEALVHEANKSHHVMVTASTSGTNSAKAPVDRSVSQLQPPVEAALHRSLLELVACLALGPARDTVGVLVCWRGPSPSNPSTPSGPSNDGPEPWPPPLPFLDALLVLAAHRSSPHSRKYALKALTAVISHCASRAANAVQGLGLAGGSQHDEGKNPALGTTSLERESGFALQRGRAIAFRVMQTLAECFGDEVLATSTSALNVALDLVLWIRALLFQDRLKSAHNSTGRHYGSIEGDDDGSATTVTESLQALFRQAGAVRSLVSALAFCADLAANSPGAPGSNSSKGSEGSDSESVSCCRISSTHGSSSLSAAEAVLLVRRVAYGSLGALVGLMRGTGHLRVGERNKASFQSALHAVALERRYRARRVRLQHIWSMAASEAIPVTHASSLALQASSAESAGTSPISVVAAAAALSPLLPLLLELEGGSPSTHLMSVVFDLVFDDCRIGDAFMENLLETSPSAAVASEAAAEVAEEAVSVGDDSSEDAGAAILLSAVQRHKSLSGHNNSNSWSQHAFTLQHGDGVPLLFLLLPHCASALQAAATRAFHGLLTAEHSSEWRNNQVASSLVTPPLLTVVLEAFPRLSSGNPQVASIALMTTLGQHSVTVAQLKRIFRLMNARRGFRPAYTWRLIKALDEMVADSPGSNNNLESVANDASSDPNGNNNGSVGNNGSTGSSRSNGFTSGGDSSQLAWRRRGPHRYFLFDGHQSGLKLPLMPRWPALKGYTFSAWVRAGRAPHASSTLNYKDPSSGESSAGTGSFKASVTSDSNRASNSSSSNGAGGVNRPSASGTAIYRPVLFAFQCSSGNGIEVCLVEVPGKPGCFTISLTCHSRKKGSIMHDLTGFVEIRAGEWHFIAVAHTRSQFRTVSSVEVVVDGMAYSFDLSFPRFESNVRGFIGYRGAPFDGTGEAISQLNQDSSNGSSSSGNDYSESGSALRGQMGAVYFFEDALSAEYLRSIYALGPNYTFFFERADIDQRHDDYGAAHSTDTSTAAGNSATATSNVAVSTVGTSGSGTSGVQETIKTSKSSGYVAAHPPPPVLNGSKALDGSLTSKIMLAFNPAVYEGDAFLDNTPEKNAVNWGSYGLLSQLGIGYFSSGPSTTNSSSGSSSSNISGSNSGSGGGNSDRGGYAVYRDAVLRPAAGQMHALRRPGTIECVTRDVRDTLDCLGGVKVLFPLFAQFDQPAERLTLGGPSTPSAAAADTATAGLNSSSSDEYDNADYTTEPKLFAWTLTLLGTLLDRNSTANQSFLEQQQGFQMVSFCLERVSPQHLTPPALAAMHRLMNIATWAHAPIKAALWNTSLPPSLRCVLPPGLKSFTTSALRHLLAHWSVWTFAADDVQQAAAHAIAAVAVENAPLVRAAVTLQWLLDGMRLYFWYTPPVSLLHDDGDQTSEVSTPQVQPSPLIPPQEPLLRARSAPNLRVSDNLHSANSARATSTAQAAAAGTGVGDNYREGGGQGITGGFRRRLGRGVVRKLVHPLLESTSRHPATSEVDGTRAKPATLRAMRVHFWAAAEAMLVHSSHDNAMGGSSPVGFNNNDRLSFPVTISDGEATALLKFMARADEDRSRSEGLQLILRLMQQSHQARAFVQTLVASSVISSGNSADEDTLNYYASSVDLVGVGSWVLQLAKLTESKHHITVQACAFLFLVHSASVVFGGRNDSEEEDPVVVAPLPPPPPSIFGDNAEARRAIWEWITSSFLASETAASAAGAKLDDEDADKTSAALACDGLLHLMVGRPCLAQSSAWAQSSLSSADSIDDASSNEVSAVEAARSSLSSSVSSSEGFASMNLTTCAIVVPDAFGALCQQLARRSLGGARRSRLLQLLKELHATSANRDALLAEPKWHVHLLHVASTALAASSHRTATMVNSAPDSPRALAGEGRVDTAGAHAEVDNRSKQEESAFILGEEKVDRQSKVSSHVSGLGASLAAGAKSVVDDGADAKDQHEAHRPGAPTRSDNVTREARAADLCVDLHCNLIFHALKRFIDVPPPAAAVPKVATTSADNVSPKKDKFGTSSASTIPGMMDKSQTSDLPAVWCYPDNTKNGHAGSGDITPLLDTLSGLRAMTRNTVLPAPDLAAASVPAELAFELGVAVLRGTLVRLRRELDSLSAKKNRWFDTHAHGGNSSQAWTATVALVWRTAQTAVDFLVMPSGTSSNGSSVASADSTVAAAAASSRSKEEERGNAAKGIVPPAATTAAATALANESGWWDLVEDLVASLLVANQNPSSPSESLRTTFVERLASSPSSITGPDAVGGMLRSNLSSGVGSWQGQEGSMGSDSDQALRAGFFDPQGRDVFLGGVIPRAPAVAVEAFAAAFEPLNGDGSKANEDGTGVLTPSSESSSGDVPVASALSRATAVHAQSPYRARRRASTSSSSSSSSSSLHVPTSPQRFHPSAMAPLLKVSGSLETGPPSPPSASPSSSRAWPQPTSPPHTSASSSPWQDDTSAAEVPVPHELDKVAHVPWLLFRLILNTAARGADASNCNEDDASHRSAVGNSGSGTGCSSGAVAGALRVSYPGTNSAESSMHSKASPQGSSVEESTNISIIALRACELVPKLLQLMAAARLPEGVDEAVHCVAMLVAALRCYRNKPQHSPWCLAALRALHIVASDARFAPDLKVAFLGNNDDETPESAAANVQSGTSPLPEVSALGHISQELNERYQTASEAAWHTLSSALGCSSLLSCHSFDGGSNDEGNAWTAWDEFTDSERRETLIAEATYVETVVVTGVRNQVTTVKQYEEAHVKATQAALATLRAQAALCTSSLRADETARLCEVLVDAERERRHSETQWGRILESLANERGPWGVGGDGATGGGDNGDAAGQRRVYWMLDSSEDHLRCRHKLMRNPLGSSHLGAAQHSGTATAVVSHLPQAPSPSPLPTTNVDKLMSSTSSESISSASRVRTNSVALWKDLSKFQKKSDMVADDDDDDDDDNLESNADGSASTSGAGISADGTSIGASSKASRRQLASGKDSSAAYLSAAAEGDDDDDDEDELLDDDANKSTRHAPGDDQGSDNDDHDVIEDGNRAGHAGAAVWFNEHVELLLRAPLAVTPGTLEVTRERIRFTRLDEDDDKDFDSSHHGKASAWATGTTNSSGSSGSGSSARSDAWVVQHVEARSWKVRDVVKLAYRHYSLRFVAMEVFFADHTVIMVNCKNMANCRKLHHAIATKGKPPYLIPQPDTPRLVLASSTFHGIGLTEAWVQREISNFEYLMHLNTLAGRTYNDLAQYPIFPWVLADYHSAELDLSSPRTFRDLRYPIGIQHSRLKEVVQERYRELESMHEPGDPMTSPHHYGACYSNPAFVLWWLLRLEPFTSLHINLSGGHFDKADRLFVSIEKAFKACTTNPMDCKELIPEFYYNSDFLTNGQDFTMGTTQGGAQVGPVELPPWAKGDASRFVRLHREALESEFVSANLHHWVDLIFGCKQRPPSLPNGSSEALKYCNVYRLWHYPDAFSMDEVEEEDPTMHRAWIQTANEFGQVPVQLFPKEPHPQRIPLHQADLIWPIASVVTGAGTCVHRRGLPPQPEPQRPKYLLSYPPVFVAPCAVIMLAELSGGAERLVSIDAARVIGYHVKKKKPPDVVPPYELKADAYALNLSLSISRGSTTTSGSSSSTPPPLEPGTLNAPSHQRGGGGESSSLSSSTTSGSINSSASGAAAAASSTPIPRARKVMTGLGVGSTSSVRERRLGVPFALLARKQLASGGSQLRSSGLGGVGSGNLSGADGVHRGALRRAGGGGGWRGRAGSSDDADGKGGGGAQHNGGGVAIASSVAEDWGEPAFDMPQDLVVVGGASGGGSGSPTPNHRSRLPSSGQIAHLDRARFGSSDSSDGHLNASGHGSSSGETMDSATEGSSSSSSSNGGDLEDSASDTNPSTTRYAADDDELGAHLFAVHGKLLFSCKHWDSSFKVTHLESGKLLQSVALHHDVVTCLALAVEGPRAWLVTASCDCTVMVWEVNAVRRPDRPIAALHTLTGHDDVVTCVAASPMLDLVVSASQDSVVVHTLFHGIYVRTLDMLQPQPSAAHTDESVDEPSSAGSSDSKRSRSTSSNHSSSPKQQLRKGGPKKPAAAVAPRIHWVGISQQGFILTYSRDDRCLCSFSVNGHLQKRQFTGEHLHAFLLSEDGKVLLTGGAGKRVVWRWCHDLSLANDGARKGFEAVIDGSCEQHKVPAFPAAVRSLAMSEHERHLMVGLDNGQVYILAPDSNYLRQRLQKQLEYLGFY